MVVVQASIRRRSEPRHHSADKNATSTKRVGVTPTGLQQKKDLKNVFLSQHVTGVTELPEIYGATTLGAARGSCDSSHSRQKGGVVLAAVGAIVVGGRVLLSAPPQERGRAVSGADSRNRYDRTDRTPKPHRNRR